MPILAFTVKPSAITNPSVEDQSSQSLSVQWDDSHDGKEILFQFMYSSEWEMYNTKVRIG
jgi:hypothetical protein